ncbi:hypothetical protein ACFQ0G_45975 [Streptomyces chiangmaiensis]
MNRVDDPRPAHQRIDPAEQLSSGLDGPTHGVVVRQIGRVKLPEPPLSINRQGP